MLVEIESLPNCIKSLRVELPSERVNAERETIARNFIQYAKIPGYRPGKAPKAIIEKRYKKEIEEELKRKLVSEGCREAIKEKNLKVISTPELEDLDLSGDSLRFTAKLTTAPEFELPEYKGIPIRIPLDTVPESEVENALQDLRERFADFAPLEGRPIAIDDFAVIDYEGFVDGQPLGEAIPDSPPYFNKREEFWIKVSSDAFLPGFAEQLVGAQAGDDKEINVTVPEDFPVESMRGKVIEFKVKVRELKQRILPGLDDEFASKVIEGKTLVELRQQIETDLQSVKTRQIEEAKRKQVTDFLAERVDCELPTNFVRSEAQRIMNDIVRDNQQRGVTNEMLKEHEKEIASNASSAAKNRLKVTFILLRIAEREKIEVEATELRAQVRNLSQRFNMSYEKTLETLEERGALGQVEEEILVGKTLDFLCSAASVSVE